jgi:hypothetical protein
MAKTSSPPAVPSAAEIDPAGTYRLKVSSVVVHGGVRLGPLADITVSGEWLAGLIGSDQADKVASATKV